MTSAIQICSNALQLLGDDPIASFTENTKRARLCANLWPMVRDDLMRKHLWSCLRAAEILGAEAGTPEFHDWGYSFLLPSYVMRILQVGYRKERLAYELAGRRIYADRDTLPLVFVKQITDPTQWDAALVDVAAKEMAARLAYPITQSASLAQLKRQEADMALRIAKSISSQDNEPEDWADSPFVDVRG